MHGSFKNACVLVLLGSNNNTSQTGKLRSNKNVYLNHSGNWKFSIRVPSLSREGLFSGHKLLHCIYTWQKELGNSVGCLVWALISMMRTHLTSEGPQLLILSPWRVGFQHMHFGKNKHSNHIILCVCVCVCVCV